MLEDTGFIIVLGTEEKKKSLLLSPTHICLCYSDNLEKTIRQKT